jgi:hypothetical protein
MEHAMKLKDIYIYWDSEGPSVSVMPKEWFKEKLAKWDGRGFDIPSKEDLANPATFFLREFVSLTYEVGVKPDDVVEAFNQIREFVELTHDVADGNLDAFAD